MLSTYALVTSSKKKQIRELCGIVLKIILFHLLLHHTCFHFNFVHKHMLQSFIRFHKLFSIKLKIKFVKFTATMSTSETTSYFVGIMWSKKPKRFIISENIEPIIDFPVRRSIKNRLNNTGW